MKRSSCCVTQNSGGGTCARFGTQLHLQGTKDPALEQLVNVPDVDLYAIDVSFSALQDKAELEYLNSLPTSFALPAQAVDRLRAAAGEIILSSPEFKRLLKDADLQLVTGR